MIDQSDSSKDGGGTLYIYDGPALAADAKSAKAETVDLGDKFAEACKEAGLPEPVIAEHSGGVAVDLLKATVIKESNAASAGKTPGRGGEDAAQFRKDFGKISERIRKEFGAETAKAFEIICQHPEYTAEQIASEVNKTSRTIENYIAKLKTAGFIVRRGPNLGGHWEIKEPS